MDIQLDQEVQRYFEQVQSTLQSITSSSIEKLVKAILVTYREGKTIYAFGNGGSGATASHFVGDLLKGVSYGLSKRVRAMCLNDNSPALLAIANDISYGDIFVEQLRNFLSPGELVIGFSGSGNSPNIVNALTYARDLGATTVAICGYNGGKIATIAHIVVHAPINDMEVCEDIHMVLTHCIKKILMRRINPTHLTGCA